MVREALKNPYLVIALVLAIVVLGTTVLLRMPVDMLPTFKTPAVQVLTLYPGMPAEVVEKDITTRLERWTGQANGIARQESRSMIGVSVVKDYFRPDIDANTAMSQVTSLAMSDLYYLPPGTLPPMVMPFDPTATLPLGILAVSSPAVNEAELYDIAYFDLRNRLQGISGVIAPAVYGGKIRRILAYVDREKLQARDLSPMDVVRSLKESNLLIPTGNAKIGSFDYQIETNAMVPTVEAMNDIPVKASNHAEMVFLRDVGEMRDSSQIQTNIVRIDGRRQVYVPIYRQPGANTLHVIDSLRAALDEILTRLPETINLDLVMDQTVFVRQAIRTLVQEGLFGAGLAAVMILLFLGNVRSTLVIMLALPLSVLSALIGLAMTGDSINAMTLGGLALVIGKLVDDGIVVLENTTRHLEGGLPSQEAALRGATEIAFPLLSATLTAMVVFVPVVLMSGIGRFLFGPLALTVVFAMTASYLLALTVVPVGTAWLFRAGGGSHAAVRYPRWYRPFRSAFDRLQAGYASVLAHTLRSGPLVVGGAVVLFVGSLALIPRLGTELFPSSDTGQLTITLRAPSGLRVELTEALVERIETTIRREIPARDLKMVISNIGVLYDWPAAYTPNAGPSDAFVLVQLTEARRESAQAYAARLRSVLAREFPDVEFAFETGGLVSAALNFGRPAPIDVQVEGNDLDVARGVAEDIRRLISRVPGTVDVRVHQRLDYPQIGIELDRAKITLLGLTVEETVKNIVTSLNSSVNFDPAFWIDPRNGNHYFVGAQYREEHIDSLQTLQDIQVTGRGEKRPIPLRNVARFTFREAPSDINHVNVTRVIDVFANVDGRDVGSVTQEIRRKIDAEIAPTVPSGYFVRVRGEYASMMESFQELGMGFLLAVLLVYLVLVAQFRSFRAPLVIMAAVPMGLMGVIWILLATGTPFNIQSFLGTIFIVGIAVSYSILMIEFAKQQEREGVPLDQAIVRGAVIRFRPILMTSLAAILALLPMAIGIGRGAEANIPLGRAVVGGLIVSTLLTLFVVPALYRMVEQQRPTEPDR